MATHPTPFTAFVFGSSSSSSGPPISSTSPGAPFPFKPPAFLDAPTEKTESKEEITFHFEAAPSTAIALENEAKLVSTYELFLPPDDCKREIREQLARYVEGCSKAILQLKEEHRHLKRQWEDEKEDKMDHGDSDLHRWLFDTYAKELPKCKIRLGEVRRVINRQNAAMRKSLELLDIVIQEVLTIEAYTVKGGPKTKPGFELFKAYLAPHGFDKDEAISRRTKRPVFRKRTTGFGGDLKTPEKNQYVMDDRGVITPRFVYAFKSSEACEDLSKGKELRGRYADGGKRNVYKVDEYVSKKIPEFRIGDEMTDEQYLFVCQEYGSSREQQRGVSLAATEKKIPSNQGTAFENSDSIKLKIDLAEMPEKEANVFNLYSPEAQERHTRGFRNRNEKLNRTFSAEQAKEHTDASTRKNREVICRKVPWSAVANQTEVRDALDSRKRRKR